MTLKIFVVVLLSVTAVGCVKQATSQSSYNKPQFKLTKLDVVVEKPYEQVWDNLLKKLPGKAVKVLNSDKKAGTISISFKTESPVHYINCGTAEGVFRKGDEVHKYSYKIAESYKALAVAFDRPSSGFSTTYAVLDRETSLEAKADIRVSPVKNNSNATEVFIKTNYVWKYKVKGQAYWEKMTGKVLPSKEIDKSIEVQFDTNSIGKGEMKDLEGPLMCASTGKLERDIMGLAK